MERDRQGQKDGYGEMEREQNKRKTSKYGASANNKSKKRETLRESK